MPFETKAGSISAEIKDRIDYLVSWDNVLYAKPKRIVDSGWVGDRVGLRGGRRQGFNPSLGQGLNMTLVDAITLAGMILVLAH